ncbi:MAG: proline dehydrogenase [Acidobacteria bacterium]|nr:MAG: proline dehydrogenase [Acidobacteriota bacterium]REK07838.1 MAG: proline dehydrogenase [Acidobacteriota bacterium]
MIRRMIAASLPLVPRPIVRRIAMRYVAGETIDDAVRCVEGLNSRGMTATLALLGEEVTDRERVEAATTAYLELLSRIGHLDSGISIKLTLLGLKIDKEYCYANLVRVLEAAKPQDTFVRLDMEDHTCTDDTLELFARARREHPHVGVVLQAYLRRTLDDIRALPEGSNVRLCKGIYIEPRRVAFQDYEKIRTNFQACLEELFEVGATVGIATHDDLLLRQAQETISRRQLPRERYEFQMLLGVIEKERDALVAAGHPMRVYVPYGDDWYLYSVRRLRENPQIAIYVLRALLGGR